VEAQLERIGKKLDNADFLAKAPAAVVEGERAKQAELVDARTKLAARLAHIEAFLRR